MQAGGGCGAGARVLREHRLIAAPVGALGKVGIAANIWWQGYFTQPVQVPSQAAITLELEKAAAVGLFLEQEGADTSAPASRAQHVQSITGAHALGRTQ